MPRLVVPICCAAARRLLQAVQQAMIGHHDVGALGEPEVVQADAGARQLGHLFEQRVRVDHRARADDAAGGRVEDAGRHQVQPERAVLVDHGVPGVVAALEADHHVGALRQVVDDPALAFIAPLGADDCCDGHGWLLIK